MPPEDSGPAQGADQGAPQGGTQQQSQGDEQQQSQPDVSALQQKLKELERDNKKYRDAQRANEEKSKKDAEAAERQKLSDVEKTQRQIADLERKLSEATQAAQTKATKAAFLSAAAKAKATYPDDIYKLVDHSLIEFDDDGNPTNVEALVDGLKKDRPTLFGQGGSFDGGARLAADSPKDMNDLLRKAAGR